jgi:hypothetical protein
LLGTPEQQIASTLAVIPYFQSEQFPPSGNPSAGKVSDSHMARRIHSVRDALGAPPTTRERRKSVSPSDGPGARPAKKIPGLEVAKESFEV